MGSFKRGLRSALAALLTVTSVPLRAAPNDRSAVGINLGFWNYFADFWLFTDMVKGISGDWSGVGTLDADGWVMQLPAGQTAENILAERVGTGRSPSNTFVLLWTGDGDVSLSGGGLTTLQSNVTTAGGRVVVRMSNPEGLLSLRITRVNPSNYPRNIRVVPIEYEGTYATQPFHPVFLEQFAKFRILRYMDIMGTNGSRQETWADRPKPTDAGQGSLRDYNIDKGVALEYLVDLANALDADPWFALPHRVNDDWVANFARLVRDRLEPGLKFYVEYSNEIWNFGAPDQQQPYCAAQGRLVPNIGYPNGYVSPFPHPTDSYTVTRNRPSSDLDYAFGYQGYRSAQIFAIIDRELTAGGQNPRTRYKRVLAAQADYHDRNMHILDTPLPAPFAGTTAYQHADVFSTAPYFYGGGSTTNAVLNALDSDVDNRIGVMRANELMARQRNMEYTTYEGGQHLDNGTQASLILAANRDPRIGTIYTKMLNGWRQTGQAVPGGNGRSRVFVHYKDAYRPGQWGAWGLLEFQGQGHPSTAGLTQPAAPKYEAVIQWIDQNPCWWTGCERGSSGPADTLPPASPRNLRVRP